MCVAFDGATGVSRGVNFEENDTPYSYRRKPVLVSSPRLFCRCAPEKLVVFDQLLNVCDQMLAIEEDQGSLPKCAVIMDLARS